MVPTHGRLADECSRVAYIVSGTGFLAGAVIFKENFSVRGLLLARIRETPQIVLRAIESRNLEEGDVEVVATVVASSRAELDLERIVGRMSLERAILAASWRTGELTNSHDGNEE